MDVTHYPPFKPFHFVHVTVIFFQAFIGLPHNMENKHITCKLTLNVLLFLGHPQTI